MAQVTVRYWAGARDAAGRDEEQMSADVLGELVHLLANRTPALAEVLQVSSLLVDGQVGRPMRRLADGDVVEVLPPFSGG